MFSAGVADAFWKVALDAVAHTMLPNVASGGFMLGDLAWPGRTSRPACIIEAPSRPVDLPGSSATCPRP